MRDESPFRQGERVFPKNPPVVGIEGLLMGDEELYVARVWLNPPAGERIPNGLWVMTFHEVKGVFSAEDFVSEDDAALEV